MATTRDHSQVSDLGGGNPSDDHVHSEIPMVAQPEPIPRLTRGPTSSELGGNLDAIRNASSRAETLMSSTCVVAVPPTASVLMAEDAADFFALSESPPKADVKRARRLTPHSRGRLPSPRRALSQPAPRDVQSAPRVGRSPARRGAWPDIAAAEHRRVPFDPAGTDVANLNKLVEQVEADGEHMAVLKAGIERLHETVTAQTELLAQHEARLSEQAAVNLRGFKEHAELKGEFTQRAVRLETATETLLTAARGPAMADLISEVAANVVDEKIAAIANDMAKVKMIIELHEARELEMASYLEGLAGERPSEGRFITSKFEVYDRSFSQVRDELARQHGATVEQFASAAAVDAVGRVELEQMSGHVRTLVSAY